FHRNYILSPDRLALQISNTLTSTCPDHSYTTQLLSLDPLVIYVNNFISDEESKYLVDIGPKFFSGFRIVGKVEKYSPQSADLPKEDKVVDCIGQRTLQFLGFLNPGDYDAPWFVKYEPGNKLNVHYDPNPEYIGFNDSNGRRFNKNSTMFIYLESECEGGETYFPFLDPLPTQFSNDSRFPATASGKGLAFKPVQGNALFWLNTHINGSVNEKARHGGLPLSKGSKYAVNIFAKHWM
ncbi:hypothetical protein F5884DRAFT_687290, partial [Xylogone sp. PMI_703]